MDTVTATATTSALSGLIPMANFLIVILFGGIVVFLQYRQGATKVSQDGLRVSSEVIDAYKEQVSQLRQQIMERDKTYQDQINTLTDKVGKLTGALEEKDRQNKQLQDLLQNKNPDIENLLKEIRSFLPQLMSKLDTMGQFGKDATAELHSQTKILEKGI